MSNNVDYLLLFRGNEWQKRLSPEELESTLGRFMGWFEGLKEEGKLKGANPLYAEGKLVSGAHGHIIVDGPFAESKEAIGGYFLISVSGEEEAVAIAQRCPTLEHGCVVEVRPVAPECPLAHTLRTATAEPVHA